MKRTMLFLTVFAALALAGCSSSNNLATNRQGAAPDDSDTGNTLQQALGGESNLPYGFGLK